MAMEPLYYRLCRWDAQLKELQERAVINAVRFFFCDSLVYDFRP